jgi:pyruvate dehydrogenase E1 component beta subunit
MPLSENCFIGAAIGSSMMKDKVVINLQRVEFALLALEQIINNAAKTYYLSNGKHNVDIVIRLIVGRGWGQGPEHSQTLESLFASIPGLKVFMPAFPFEAYQLMNLAIKDPNPIIFLENRWCHYNLGKINKLYKTHDKSFSKLSNGNSLTLISSGYASTICFQLVNLLKKYNINIDFFNLKIIKPLNIEQIKKSILKTKKIITIDSGHKILGIGSEIIAKLAEEGYKFKKPPIRLGMPDHPTPSSRSFIDKIYVNSEKILDSILTLVNVSKKIKNRIKKENTLKNNNLPKDIPDPKFKGPF